MLGQAAPFLGQGGIDPRMVSGPSSDYMNQMASLPIYAQRGRVPAGGYGGPPPRWEGAIPPQFQGGGNGYPTDAARMGIDNGQTQGPLGGQGGGSMPSYLGGGMEQPYMRSATAFGGSSAPPPPQSYAQQWGQQPGGGPASWGPAGTMPQSQGPAPQQPFRPQGPGQRVTQDQLAARGLNPQEIQRRLQQFAGGQLGWQQGQGGGGQGGGLPHPDPNNPNMNDPRVQEFIRRMTGNPAASGPGGGDYRPAGQPSPMDPAGMQDWIRQQGRGDIDMGPYGQTRQGIRRMVPQDPRQGMPRPPAGPDYGNDMIARPIPPQQPPMRPGMQNRTPGGAGAGRMPRSDRPQIPRMG